MSPKKLKPATVHKIYYTVGFVAMVLELIGLVICFSKGASPYAIFWPFMGVMLIASIFEYTFYRCPHCGKWPGRVGAHDCCSKCGYRLDADDGSVWKNAKKSAGK